MRRVHLVSPRPGTHQALQRFPHDPCLLFYSSIIHCTSQQHPHSSRRSRLPRSLRALLRNINPHRLIPHLIRPTLLIPRPRIPPRAPPVPRASPRARPVPKQNLGLPRVVTAAVSVAIARLAPVVAAALHTETPLGARLAEPPVAVLVGVAVRGVLARVSAMQRRGRWRREAAVGAHVEGAVFVQVALPVNVVGWREFAGVLRLDGWALDALLAYPVVAE